MPVRRRRWIAAGILALVLLLACACTVFILHRPKVFEGGVQVDYMLGTKPVRVYVTFEGGAKADGEAIEVCHDRQMAGSVVMVPSQLFVWSGEDPKAQEEFAEQIRDCTVTRMPRKLIGLSAMPELTSSWLTGPTCENRAKNSMENADAMIRFGM